MLNAISNPLLTVAELPGVVALLRVLSVIWGMSRQSKQDRELTECTQRLNSCQEKLKQSEEQRRESEYQREMLLYALLVVLAVVAVASINYRMVPRSLPA